MLKPDFLSDEQFELLKAQSLVYLVDDDSAIRSELAERLDAIGIKTLQFGTAEDFLRALTEHRPAVIVSDMSLPGLSGLDLFKTVREAGFDLPLVFISGYSQPNQIIDGMKLGAVDFLWKPFKSDALLNAVCSALAKDLLQVKKITDTQAIKDKWHALTDREKEVCELMLAGYGNTLIGERLDIQPDTVNKHRQKVLGKMQVSSRAELIELLRSFSVKDF